MIETVKSVLSLLNDFLSTESPARALVFGFLLSVAITQTLKKTVLVGRLPAPHHRDVLQGIAILTGWAGTAALWPDWGVDAWAFGFLNGLGSIFVYKYATLVLFHYFPWLEPKMSGKPKEQES